MGKIKTTNSKPNAKMSQLFTAMQVWNDEDKSYETDITVDEGEFAAIKNMVDNGDKLSDDEIKQYQDNIYEWNEAMNQSAQEGNSAKALVYQKVLKNMEHALQYYRKKNHQNV